ncbi:MAG: hypothetical protein R3C02_20540 [Planctomycetaceae bacterium]
MNFSQFVRDRLQQSRLLGQSGRLEVPQDQFGRRLRDSPFDMIRVNEPSRPSVVSGER